MQTWSRFARPLRSVLLFYGAAAGAVSASAGTYSLLSFDNLGLFDGRTTFTIGGVNDAGQVVGSAVTQAARSMR